MSSGLRRWVCASAICLLVPHSVLAEKSLEAQKQCPYWQTLQGATCVPCPEDQQAVIDGHDTCTSGGALAPNQQDDEDDEEQK